MDWTSILTTVGVPVIGLLATVATALAYKAEQWVKAKYLNGAAQDAFANAAGGIVNKLGEDLLTTVLSPSNHAVQAAVSQVVERIPDTVKALGLTPAGIAERIVDHVGKLQAPAIGSLLPSPIADIAKMIGGVGGQLGSAAGQVPPPPLPQAAKK